LGAGLENTLIISLLQEVKQSGASDLLLTKGAPPQLRINGLLHPLAHPPLTEEDIERCVEGLLNQRQKLMLETYKSVDFSCEFKGSAKFRFNVYYQRGALALASRIIPDEIPSFSQLGLPGILKEFAERPSGLFLVTGPAGSGKSTTLAAMMNYINARKPLHIITLEDPIEYEHHHQKGLVDQREVGTDVDSFAEALKAVTRQSPDVIMVGELRDLESIALALTIAETGHLVLGTLHTRDAVHAVSRIVDVFPASQQEQIYVQLSQVLIGVAAQQLILARDESRLVLACEVMQVNSGIQNLIREKKVEQVYSMIQAGRGEGMVTMNESLSELVSLHLIDPGTALSKTTRPKELLQLLDMHHKKKK
jgi:twitching motility protein PilT